MTVKKATGPLLPDPGAVNRFWHITHEPKRHRNPIRVELRERLPEAKKSLVSLSSLVGFTYTVAVPDKIFTAALQVRTDSGHAKVMVGIYETAQ